VDGLGRDAGRFGQALGGAARGGAEQAPDFLGPQDEQNGVDQRGLADARPARKDEHPVRQRLPERGLLAGRKFLAGLSLAPGNGLARCACPGMAAVARQAGRCREH